MKAYYPPDVGPNFWRDIPGYGGKYQASRNGDIRRVFGSGKVRDLTPHWKFITKPKKHHLLVTHLTLDGHDREVSMLRIMADTWKGKPPAGRVACHINGIISDNRADNIGFIDRKTLGRRTGGSRRKPVRKLDKDGNVVEVYVSAREAARANHMSYQTVLDRCHRKVKNEYALDGHTYRFDI